MMRSGWGRPFRYAAFEEPFGSSDFKLQNARPSPYCLYSQSGVNRFPLNGNCFAYFPNEWMTFQVHVKTGPRVGDEFARIVSSNFGLLAKGSRRSRSSIGVPITCQRDLRGRIKFTVKVWLLPYDMGKDPSQSHPTAFT
jgi:hypothetical protein